MTSRKEMRVGVADHTEVAALISEVQAQCPLECVVRQ